MTNNQRIITIMKEDNSNFNSENFKNALKFLDSNCFKMWCYFMSFKSYDKIQLSRVSFCKDTTLSESTYHRSFKKMVELGFLIQLDDINFLFKESSDIEISKKEKELEGYIYLIKVLDFYKIGRTSSPETRLGEYTKLMTEPQIIICSKVKNQFLLEKSLHDLYKDKNTRGEWYNLTETDVNYIKNIIKKESV